MQTRNSNQAKAPGGSVVSHTFSSRLHDKKVQALKAPDFASLDPTGLFDIPWKDVVCFKDSANVSKADPIEIGGEAALALERLYAEFGVSGTPATWGELMGSVAYCKGLHANCNYPRVNPEDDALWFNACLKVTRKYSPELVEATLAYHEGRKDDLAVIFKEQFGLAKCSYHFDPLVGWDSFPDEK